MRTFVARRLLRINARFYQQFGAEFAASRSALQPGMLRALPVLTGCAAVLDVGCGNGRFGGALPAPVRYVGVDSSATLLGCAAQRAHASFLQLDLMDPAWVLRVLRRFPAIVCFAVLHHVPGARRRLRLLRQLHGLLLPGGVCVLSVWQFAHVPRLRRKICDWQQAGVTAAQVDAQDYLLDWQRGGSGLRYAHQFSLWELAQLCARAGFEVRQTYRSDGATGDMGLYVILRAVV